MDLLIDDLVVNIVLSSNLDTIINIRDTCKKYREIVNNVVVNLCNIYNLYPTSNFYLFCLMYSKVYPSRYNYLFKLNTSIVTTNLDDDNKLELIEVIKTNNLDLIREAWSKYIVVIKDTITTATKYNKEKSLLYHISKCSKEVMDYFISEYKKEYNVYVLGSAIITGNIYLIKSLWVGNMNEEIKETLMDYVVMSKNIELIQSVDVNFPEFELVEEISTDWILNKLNSNDRYRHWNHILLKFALREGNKDIGKFVIDNIKYFNYSVGHMNGLYKAALKGGILEWFYAEFLGVRIRNNILDKNETRYLANFIIEYTNDIKLLEWSRILYPSIRFGVRDILCCIIKNNYNHIDYIFGLLDLKYNDIDCKSGTGVFRILLGILDDILDINELVLKVAINSSTEIFNYVFGKYESKIDWDLLVKEIKRTPGKGSVLYRLLLYDCKRLDVELPDRWK